MQKRFLSERMKIRPREIAGDAAPVCFYVPAVTFRFAGETYDFIPAPELAAV